eukprot:m.94293 g.94293  ORF g.94293 m.94293 type:complete len:143 (+) comp36812_c0_seq24:138-566(+)
MARKLDADTRKRRGFRRSFAGRRMVGPLSAEHDEFSFKLTFFFLLLLIAFFFSIRAFCSKMFVGGLSWETTESNLKKHFSQFGEVLECNIKMDNTTKKSRGFGFVLYSSPDHVRKVASIIHYIAHKIANGDYIAPNVGPRTI